MKLVPSFLKGGRGRIFLTKSTLNPPQSPFLKGEANKLPKSLADFYVGGTAMALPPLILYITPNEVLVVPLN